mgnify:FL=1|jgi:hypothetical protein
MQKVEELRMMIKEDWMNILDILKRRNIVTTEIPKWGTYLRKQWEDNFAGHLTQKEKAAIFLHDYDGCCGYLWHIFSYEKRECLKGKEAEQAFNQLKKKECFLFYQQSEYALILEDASRLTSEDLKNERNLFSDIFIADKNFNWTYVNTHETYCGPYFCMISK